MFYSSRERFGEFRAHQRASGDGSGGDNALKPSREQRKRYMRDYRSFLWPFKRTFVAVFLLALLSAALSMLPPLATRYIIDRVLTSAQIAEAATRGKVDPASKDFRQRSTWKPRWAAPFRLSRTVCIS